MPCCPFYYQVSVHNRGDAYSILESDAKGRCRYGCCRRNHSSLPLRKLESDTGHRSRNDRCRRAILHRHDDYAASIRKSGPEIRNQCTQEGLNGKNLHRFASSGLKSRIDARKRVLTRKSLHRFSSLGTKSRINARSRPPSARVH